MWNWLWMEILYSMWQRFFFATQSITLCQNVWESSFRGPEMKLDESRSAFGVKTTHGFLSSGKSASLQWLSGRQLECLGTLPCLATVSQVCIGSVAACCSVSGPALFDHPSRGNWIVPQCQDATESNQPLFFPNLTAGSWYCKSRTTVGRIGPWLISPALCAQG